uniref:Uncharacterized protein n=1 Tax=Anopheles epiroticus TaxID=199890 RepID=A0A182PF72_9DIPT
MHSFQGRWFYTIGLILFAIEVQYIMCKTITSDPRHQSLPLVEHTQSSTLPEIHDTLHQSIDSKAKLDGMNRALHERLQQTRSNLRPLQTRAAQLQRRFDVFQRTAARRPSNPARARTERNQLLQEAHRLRAAVERKLQGFGALDQRYRSMRTMLEPKPKLPGLPRAWLDRDTERQMELNERIYKNIIDLLVHLIECPVNIIHDVMEHDAGAATEPTPAVTHAPPLPDYSSADETDADEDEPFDEQVVLSPDIGEVPWLEEFHY